MAVVAGTGPLPLALREGSATDSGAVVVHHAFVGDEPLGPDGESVAAETELLTMGRGDQGQLMSDEEFRAFPRPVPGLSVRAAGQLVQASASTFHTAVVTNLGELFVAGNNEDGQIAADSAEPRIAKPRTVGALESQRVLAVAAGDTHTACVNSDGQVISFGSNEMGQLGHGPGGEDEVYRRPPRVMRGLAGVRAVQVACGEDFTVVLGASGDVYTVGSGAHGCLGHGVRTPSSTPERVKALVGIPCTQVAAGPMHAVAATVTGLAYSWGRNKSGRLGLPSGEVPHTAYSPRRVAALPELVQQVACGDDHTVFVTRTGRAFVAGSGARGQLGLALPDRPEGSAPPSATRHPLATVDVPRRVEALEGHPVRQAACGRGFTVFLLQDGAVLACGANDAGQTGLLATEEEVEAARAAEAAAGGTGADDDAADGDEAAAATAADGDVSSPGAPGAAGGEQTADARARAHPASAQSLGFAPPFRPTDVPLPTAVPALSHRGIFAIEAGAEHSLALRVVAGSVLSTPPGSMPRGSMAFTDAATVVAAAGWAAASGDTGPLSRLVRTVFGDASALNGSFLRSAPEDLKLIEVRAPGAPSLVRRLARLAPARAPRLLHGADAAIRSGGPARGASGHPAAPVPAASPADGTDDSEDGAAAASRPPGLGTAPSSGAAFSISRDDVDDDPPPSPARRHQAADGAAAAAVRGHRRGDTAASASGDVGTVDVVALADTAVAQTARSASVDSLDRLEHRRVTYPLSPVGGGGGAALFPPDGGDDDPRAREIAVAKAGGPFPAPRVVVMFPEFRVVGGGTPFPAVADVKARLETSGIDVAGLETAYRAMFAAHFAREAAAARGEAGDGDDDPLAPAAGASARPSGVPRFPSAGPAGSLPGPDSAAAAAAAAAGDDGFVVASFYAAVTSMLADVRRDVQRMAEPECPRFLLVLLLCPLLCRPNSLSSEVVARVCEALLALPPSTRDLVFKWAGDDVPPALFAGRVLRTLHAHLDVFVRMTAAGSGSAELCSDISFTAAMESTARCLGALFAVNERVAAANRARAMAGRDTAVPAAAAATGLGPHLASDGAPPFPGIYGIGLLDPSRRSTVGAEAGDSPGAHASFSSSSFSSPSAAAAAAAAAIRSSGAARAAAAASSSSSSSSSSPSPPGAAPPADGVRLAPGVTFMTGIDEEEGDGDVGVEPDPSGFAGMHARVSAWLDGGGRSGAGRPLSAEELESTAWGLVHFSAFYSASLSALPDPVLRRHYDAWRSRGFRIEPGELNLCGTPFLLSASAKRRVLSYEAALQQTREAHNAIARAMFFGGASPYLVLQVRRENLLGDALTFLSQQHPHALKKPLRVVFVGEDGIDAGGVTREFFQITTEALSDPMLAMLERLPSGEYTVSPNSLESDTEFRLAGLVCGLAIYNNVVLDLPFARFLYRKLLGEPLDVFDLTAAHPELGRGLQQLLAYEGDDLEDVFCLDFTVAVEAFGATSTVELVPGGADRAVTAANRREYVDSVVDYHLNRAIERQFAAFARGFLSVADGPALHLFRAEELSQLVSGQGFLDYDELRRATVYEGGFSADHPTVRRFWRAVRGMTDQQRRKLLLFATGASRAPIGGLGKLDPPFKLQRNGPDSDRLPTASTCFHTVLLPDYSSDERLRRLLLVAVEECRGFGLQ